MWKIARYNGMSYSHLLSLNPQITNPSNIWVGEHVNTTHGQLANQIVHYARSIQDITKYKYGAKPSEAPWLADCSSWVQHVYRKFGINLPRSSRAQSHVGMPVTFKQIKRGDLLFFGSKGRVTHVGIYLGHGYWISNLDSSKDVAILSVWGSWSYRHFLWGQRVIPR